MEGHIEKTAELLRSLQRFTVHVERGRRPRPNQTLSGVEWGEEEWRCVGATREDMEGGM